MALGGGTFGGCLGHKDGALIKSTFINRGLREHSCLLLVKDTIRSKWSTTQKRVLSRPNHAGTPFLLAPDFGLPASENCELYISVVYKHPTQLMVFLL